MNNDIKLKVFISTAMRGLSDKEVEKKFDYITEMIFRTCQMVNPNFERANLFVIDSYNKDFPEGTHAVRYLTDSINLMLDADLIIFYRWKGARGCRVEKLVADEYYMNTLDIEEISMDGFYHHIRRLLMLPVNGCGGE